MSQIITDKLMYHARVHFEFRKIR